MTATPESTLADTRRSKADLQRENAELRRTVDERTAERDARTQERDEALAREAATAEVLGVINSSPGDLKPVFDAMLEKALRLCGGAFGILNGFDGQALNAVAMRGVPAAFAEFRAHHPATLGPGTPPARIVAGENVVHTLDLKDEEAYRRGDPNLRAIVDLGGARSHLAVAFRKHDSLLGMLTIYRQEVRAFSEKQIALLQNFAAQAVIAMENARLITETREALEQQTATADVLQVINSSPGDLAPVFDAILEKAHSLCGVTFGFLQLYDSGKLRAVALRGVPEAVVEPARQGFSPGPNHPIRGLLDGVPYVHIRDLAEIDDPAARRVAQLGGIRTSLFVALRKDGALLGMISAGRKEIRPFTEKQIALLQNFAAQAIIAMENARLITETREALEQQTATAEVLGVINASPGDLAPVFDAILEKAHSLCGIAFGTLQLYENEHFRAVATHGLPEQMASLVRQPYRMTDPDSLGGHLLSGGRFYQSDLAEEIAQSSSPNPRGKAALEICGIRTLLFLPLRKDNQLIGMISAGRKEVRPFVEKEIALLENFAAQAVIAIENARLITETREALEQQTATAEVLQVINSSPGDLAPVFDAMLEKATRLCEAAFGTLAVVDGETIQLVAERNVPRELVEFMKGDSALLDPETILGQSILQKRVIHTADNAASEAYRQRAPLAVAAVELGGIRTVLHVPLIKDDRVVGIFVVFRQEVRPFTDKQIALLENFAAQAVIAMENARLLTETREALEQQTATTEVLQVINSSPSDLTPVFEAILENAHRLCGAVLGTLTIREGDQFRTVAMHGVPELFAALLRQPFSAAPGGGIDRLLQGERIVHIADIAKYGIDNPVRSAAIQAGVRTLLFVPLRKDGSLLGHITAHREEVRPFSEKQIALLENFAAQAVIAMENARLISETKEALEQQTATAEVLGVINSSPGDLAPVFHAMLEKATRLCQAAAGTFWANDGEQWHPVAVRGMPEQFVQSAVAYRPSPMSPVGQIASGEKLVHLADLAAADVYRAGDALVRAAVDQHGIRTLLSVPLHKEDRLLGVFSVYRREVRPFTDKQVALVQNFAAQAVIAMENARLLTETREALEQQTATAEVLQVINRSPGDLAPVFDAMLEKAMRLCDAAFGHMFTYDGDHFRTVASHGSPAKLTGLLTNELSRPTPNSPPRRIIDGENIVSVEDLRAFPSYQLGESRAVALVELGGVRSYIIVALRKDRQLLGMIAVYRQEVRPFTDKQIALLQNFAVQAVIAMENARLLGELRQRTEEVAGFNRELEARVADQLAELERTGKLRRFLAPQLADLIIAQGDESILESHRREIVVVFCDIRGFTSFAERTEPEEVMALLREYHAALGPIVARFEGTLDHYSGDGVMVFFNDPLPTPEPAKRAIEMAVALREAAQQVLRTWRRHGHDLGFGVGISQGYATLGQIGFAERMDYTAIGTVTNLAARLCSEAKDGQILISRRVAVAVEEDAKLEEIGEVSLKGLSQAVAVYNVVQ